MFHVKQCLALVALIGGGCGYQAVHGGASADTLAVASAPSLAGSAAIRAAALSGARGALAQEGALRPGAGLPRLVVEVVRIDEHGVGLVARRDPSAPGGARPEARGLALAVVGRAWVERKPGERTWATGDVRRVARVAPAESPSAEATNRDQALQVAARELGGALARRALGSPEPRDEGLF